MHDPVPARVFVAVGANLDPEKNIRSGIRALAERVPVVAVSSFYRSAAIGRPDQPDYLNGVLELRTTLEPLALRDGVLRPVEAETGRVRSADRYAARTLDLDILLYGEACLATPELRLPDPDILARAFLAAGLLEIDPELILPGESAPLADLTDSAAMAALVKDLGFSREMKEMLNHES